MQIDILLTESPLFATSCIEKVMQDDCGGINVFIGTVRNSTSNKTVIQLEFEAYQPMAVSEIKKIAEYVLQNWSVKKILIHHRTGILKPGEIPVIIAVSAAHRDAAFEACRYTIDTLKKTVPIWKKEVFEDGETWVSAHP